MRNYRKILIYCMLLPMSLVVSCKDGFEAFEGSGKIITVSRPVTPFNSVLVNDNINLVISHDSVFTIKVEAGENWMDDINTDVKNLELVLENNNRFQWLKSQDKKITVYISVPTLNHIYYQGLGNVNTTDTLYAEELTVEAIDGAGSINLNVNTKTLNIKSLKGVVDFTAKGRTNNLYIYSAAVSPIQCNDLQCKKVTVISRSTNECYVNVETELEARLSAVGNVFYWGDPDTIISTATGSGRLIKL